MLRFETTKIIIWPFMESVLILVLVDAALWGKIQSIKRYS
jgi:hypothetical protein